MMICKGTKSSAGITDIPRYTTVEWIRRLIESEQNNLTQSNNARMICYNGYAAMPVLQYSEKGEGDRDDEGD